MSRPPIIEVAPPDLPPDYAGAYFSPKELRAVNKELAKLGRRICSCHQGAALPLDEAHFYWHSKAEGRFRSDCKACSIRRETLRFSDRYFADADFHRQHNDTARRSHLRHYTTQQRRTRYPAQKAAKLARVLAEQGVSL